MGKEAAGQGPPARRKGKGFRLKKRFDTAKGKLSATRELQTLKVKDAALNDAASGLQGRSSIDDFARTLKDVAQRHKAQGLKSLRAKVDPSSLEITIEARASAPVGHVLRWETAFNPSLHPTTMTTFLDELRKRLQKKGPDSDKQFTTDTPVWAALSVDGVFVGQQRNIPGGTHAETRLLASHWHGAVAKAISSAKESGAESRVVFAIDRAPCPACSTTLKAAIAGARREARDAGVGQLVIFTLGISSNYEGQSLSGKKVAEQTAAGAPPKKTTMISATRAVEDIGGLVHAGWDVRQLLAREVQNKTWDAPLAEWLAHLQTPEMKARLAKKFATKV